MKIDLFIFNLSLSNNQFGFRPDKSIIGVLSAAKIFIYKRNILAVLLDLAKDFDIVDHNKLINILSA